MNISFVTTSKSLVVLIGLYCGSLSALGGEFVNAKSLIESCKQVTDKNVPKLCGAYIQGYLEASQHIIKETQLPSEFMMRALKTRAPHKDVAVETVSKAKYCVPEKGFVFEFVGKVSQVDYNPDTQTLASTVVESVLIDHYSCKSDK
ncbi:MAG: hypothetical protein HWE27_11330 [Gammaproteobacteria bacterium]|nr:hypothetical protein [Gammaproteobacteria bacterium]